MEERIRFNKVSLREQKQKKAIYSRFLPVLEAKKQQLLMQLTIVRNEIDAERSRMKEIMDVIVTFGPLYLMMEEIMKHYIAVNEVRFSYRNIAGLKMREFRDVVFDEPGHSLFMTPYSFDQVLGKIREAISFREKIRMLEEQMDGLEKEFRKASQRINLYEKRLIPGCTEVIRKIAVHLQDQQAAAVGVAKVAKRLSEEASYYSRVDLQSE